jgi:hypothetical protein
MRALYILGHARRSMQKKKLKTLSLNRETLRRLEPRDLSGVAGGFSLPPSQCGASNHTCDDCPTYSCGLYNCL